MAYVRYSDYCNSDRVEVFDGNKVQVKNKLGHFCGHVLLETFYTNANTATLLLHCLTVFNVHMEASYVVVEKFSAFRFNGSMFIKCFCMWNITAAHSPLWVYSTNRVIDYLWHYVTPSYDNITHTISNPGMNMERTLKIRYPSVYISIIALYCKDNKTSLRSGPGLLPYIWSTMQNNIQYCNVTNHFIPFVKHRFMTLLFRLNPFDTDVVFNINFYVTFSRSVSVLNPHKFWIQQNNNLIHPMSLLTIFGSIMPIQQHDIVNDVRVTKFKYEGFYRNLQATHIYDVLPTSGQRKIPSGWSLISLTTLLL